MASGSFARGRDAINASASMVFIGNINQPVDTLVKTSHLLAPFPEAMIDSAFFDRFHAYVPGWEIPKMRPEFFTNQYGLIVDYLAEYLREMRKRTFRRRDRQVFQARQQPQPARYNRRAPHRLRAAEAALSRMASTTRKRSASAWSMRWRPAAGSRSSSRRSAAWSSTTSISPTSTARRSKSVSSACRSRAAAS